MPLQVQVLGRVRQILDSIQAEPLGEASEQIALTQQLEQVVAAGAAPFREVVKPGRAFLAGSQAAIAAVVAVPTTGHMFAIYNNEADGGRTYVIDAVGALNIVSTAVSASAVMLANIGQVREATPTDAMPAGALRKANGFGTGADTRVRAILNATALPAATGVAANWFVATPVFAKAGAAATPGYGIWQPIDGRYLVPPGRYFAVHVMANVVGETFLASIAWHELQLTLA